MRLSPRRLVVATAAACVLAVAPAAHAQSGPWPTVVIDTPSPYQLYAVSSLNNRGVVAGAAELPADPDFRPRPFRWRAPLGGEAAAFEWLALPEGAAYAIPYDINDKGQIVGQAAYPDGRSRGVVWQPDGTPAVLPGGVEGIADDNAAAASSAFGINEQNQLVGFATTPSSESSAVRYEPVVVNACTRVMTNLNPGPDAQRRPPGSRPLMINEGGKAAVAESPDSFAADLGDHQTVLYSSPGASTVRDIAGGPQGLNDSDQIAGTSRLVSGAPDSRRALMWDGQRFVPLGAQTDNTQFSAALSLNNNAWVVGRVGGDPRPIFTGDAQGTAFLWRPAPQPGNPSAVNANPQNLEAVAPAGWSELSQAVDVNDRNQIIGFGVHQGRGVGFFMAPDGLAQAPGVEPASGCGGQDPPPGGGDPPPGGGGTPPPGGGDPPPAPPPPGPTVIGPAGNPLGLPTRRKCVDTRKFSFRLHHGPGARIVKVVVFINGKRKIVKTGTNIRRLTLKRLPKKKFVVRIEATQNTGSKLISKRTYKGCKKSRARTRRGGRRR